MRAEVSARASRQTCVKAGMLVYTHAMAAQIPLHARACVYALLACIEHLRARTHTHTEANTHI